jgi:endo-1,4-beta-xylanase
VAPSNADNKTIAWSVKDPGGTGVSAEGIVNNKFTPAAAGTLTLTATIANGKAQGENYTKDFAIAIAPADTFVAVTDISGVPTGATAGAEADLSYAEVAPSNADNKTIAWSVKDPGGTGVTTAGIVNGKFTPTAAGTLTLTATIANGKAQGENYAKDFTIVIAPAFVAVTGISNVPTGGTEGSEVDLSYATVAPDNATNKTIVWTVKDAGTTGVGDASITAGKFTPASAGTLTLTATIANGTAPGTPFATEFDIIIAPLNTFVAVTNITGVPDGTDAGSEVDLSYATVVPDNADNQDIVWTVKDAGTTGLATADIVDGKFTAPLPGSVKLTATIANGTAEGTDYTKEFTIIISVPGSFVAVTSITGVPSEGVVGTLVSLANAAAVPSTATYKTISWVVKTAGAGVTSIAGNSFTPTATGKVTLTARILSGAAAMQPYTKDFEITINPAFVAVTGINGLPDTLNAVTGVAIDLNAGISVAPTDATNKTIAWSVKTPGDTGLTDTAVASGVFTPANAGTVTLTATILNGTAQGTNYTQDIAITIIKPVTAIAGVPTNGTRGYAVSLVGAVAQPADATNKTPIVWSVKTAGAGVATITGTSFTPTSTGTVTLTATIANGSALGTAFAREFTITISEPGTTSPEIGLPEYPSIVLMDKDNKPLPLDEPIPVELNSSYYVVISSDYTNIAWYLNGTKEEAVTGTLIYLPTTTARTIKLFVEGKKNGRLETGNYTFQVASSN